MMGGEWGGGGGRSANEGITNLVYSLPVNARGLSGNFASFWFKSKVTACHCKFCSHLLYSNSVSK